MSTTSTVYISAAIVIQEKGNACDIKHIHAVAVIANINIHFVITNPKSSIPPKDADHNRHVFQGTRPHLNLPVCMTLWEM